MQIIVENSNFEIDDICISKFEYFDKKGTKLHESKRLFCEKYGNTKTNNIENLPTECAKFKVEIILITTQKKVGSKCV